MLSKYKNKKSPLKEKRKKTLIATVAFLSILSIGYFGYTLLKLKPTDGQKEEIKIETGDRPLPKKIQIIINSDKGLSLRKSRDANAERLAVVPDKTKIEASEELDGWYKISYEGKEGWISKQYTTLASDVPATDQFASWSEYKNAAYKIKYPLGWKLQDYGTTGTDSSFVAFSNQDLPSAIPQGTEFVAPIVIEISTKTLEDAQKQYSTISGVSTENINISSISAVKYTYTSVSSNTQMTAIVAKSGDKVLIFSEAGGYLDDLTNMLKTFS